MKRATICPMNNDRFGRANQAPSLISPSISDDAKTFEEVVSESANLAGPSEIDIKITSYLPDLKRYDLTISEALDLFPSERRKRPSERSLQRYCQDGRFDCYKLKTTRNNNPVHEWIINSASLLKFIHSKPVEEIGDDSLPPKTDGDANPTSYPEDTVEEQGSVMTTPDKADDANTDTIIRDNSDFQHDGMATPNKNGDANPTPSKVALLIENAELTAKLDAKDELVAELREDKKFMREQITLNRTDDKQIAKMHGQTLEALKAVSLAGRHTKIETGETPKLMDANFEVHPPSRAERPSTGSV